MDNLRQSGGHAPAGEDSVLGKVNLLLSSFSPGVTSLGLTDLARRSGVPKASAYRLAQQLVDVGYLVKTEQGYQLGWRIYEFGQFVPGPALLRSVARPMLVDLRAGLKALVVHLGIPQGADIFYLERIGGRREIKLLEAVGTSVPAEQTVSGRLLAAYRVEEEPGETVSEARREEYRAIRSRRWASESNLVVPGAKSFAVPIEYPGSGRPVAALSATVHVQRQDDQVILRALWGASTEIGKALQRGSVR